MSKIKNGGLDKHGAKPFEWQQFGTAGVEGVNNKSGLSPKSNPLFLACAFLKHFMKIEFRTVLLGHQEGSLNLRSRCNYYLQHRLGWLCH